MKKGKLVSLVKGKNRKENLKKALALIRVDLGDFKKAKTVLLKPNLTSAYNATANTSSEAVEAVLGFFQNFDLGFKGKKVFIFEDSGEAFNRGETMASVYRRFGYGRILRKYSNLKIIDLNEEKTFLEIPIVTIDGKKMIRVPKKVLKFDYKISLAIPKTHDTVGITLGIKNFLMGMVKREDKSLMHGLGRSYSDFQRLKTSAGFFKRLALLVVHHAPWRINWLFNNFLPAKLKDKVTGFDSEVYLKSVACLHRNLFLVGQKIMPDLVVIDGLYGMEGDGPVYGHRRNLGVAIASTDPVAADAVGAKVIGFAPEKIGYLRLLAKAGKGELSLENLVGEKIASVSQKFRPHRHYRYQLKGVKRRQNFRRWEPQ